MEALNNEDNATRTEETSPVESEQDKTNQAIEGLRVASVKQARTMLAGLAEAITDENATRILRIMADLCTTNIGLLTDLDPAGVRGGPRVMKNGPNVSPYGLTYDSGVNIGEPMVAGGQSNETFGAQALGQLLALVPQLQIGVNAKGLTYALSLAKESGLDEEAKLISTQLKSLLGGATGELEEMPPVVASDAEETSEEPLRECMYCGREISRNEDMCRACSDAMDAEGTGAAS